MEVTLEKTRSIMTSALMSVLVAAFPQTISKVDFNIFFSLNDDQQKKHQQAYYHQAQNETKVANTDDQISIELYRQLLVFNLISSENKLQNNCVIIEKASTDRQIGSSEDSLIQKLSQSKSGTANELRKLTFRGTFTSSSRTTLLSRKLTRNTEPDYSSLSETAESLLSLLTQSDVTAIILCSNVCEGMSKEHFILHANPTAKADGIVGRSTPTLLSLRNNLRRGLLSCNIKAYENLSQFVQVWICTEDNATLLTRETKQAQVEQHSSPFLASFSSSLRGLSSSPCANAITESKAECQSLSNEPSSTVKSTQQSESEAGEQKNSYYNSDKVNPVNKVITSAASAMGLNDQLNNIGEFPMESGDGFGDFNEDALLERINEYDADNAEDRVVGREGDEDEDSELGSIIMSDYEDADCDDSDGFYGSYSNPPLLGTSPLPRRSPLHLFNAHALEGAGQIIAGQTFFDLRNNFGASLPQCKEESQEETEQAVPSS